MVKLVQTLEMLPTCDLATQPMIQFHYAFALNRYKEAGSNLIGNQCIVLKQYVKMDTKRQTMQEGEKNHI